MRTRSLLLLAALASCVVPDKIALESGDGGVPDDGSIDGTAPETTLTDGPESSSRDDSPTFTFTADEPATFLCSIDGEAPIACSSPYTRDLGDGPHTFSVRAVDTGGNADDTPAELVWTIDTVAPETTITVAPPSTDNSVVVSFEFTATEEGSTFTCSIDGGAFVPCESGGSFGPVGEGAHSFSVRAADAAGNTDGTPAIHAWAVDTTMPDTQILAGPSGAVSSTSASFSFASPDAGSGATYQCALDTAGFTACSSPTTYTGLAEGHHTFAVRVRDSVGNIDPTPATRGWDVDLSAPETTIDAGPSATVALASASFAFSSDEPGSTFECKLDGGGYDACASPTSYTGLSQGSHTFLVRAMDEAGHRDPTPASRTWTVDTIAPETSILSGPSGTVSSGSATFDLSSTEAGSFECALDGGAFAACSDPAMFDVGPGGHTLEVRAIDDAGNQDASPATRTWTVDTMGPVVTITSGPAEGSTSGPHVTFGFTVSEGTPLCSFDADAFTACTSPVSANLDAGAHTFRVRATDGSGNEATATRTWTVDCDAPGGAGGAGLFHLDEGAGQTATNALGPPDAVLGDDATAEPADPAWLADARFGGGLTFGAGDHVTWPAGMGTTGDLSIELWARATGAGDLVVSGDNRVALRVLDGVRFAFSVSGPSGPAETVTSGVVAAGQWHHVIATFDEPALHLWVDGVRTDDTASFSGMAVTLDTLVVGDFPGDLDELHVTETPISTDADALPRYCPN